MYDPLFYYKLMHIANSVSSKFIIMLKKYVFNILINKYFIFFNAKK